MKVMIFANLLVGDAGAFNMPPKVLAARVPYKADISFNTEDFGF